MQTHADDRKQRHRPGDASSPYSLKAYYISEPNTHCNADAYRTSWRSSADASQKGFAMLSGNVLSVAGDASPVLKSNRVNSGIP